RWWRVETAEPGLQLVGFGRELRRRGLAVGTGRIVTFCRGAAALSPLDHDDLYWAARSSLISRPDDVPAFDRAFHEYFALGVRFELGPLPPEAESLARRKLEEEP